MLGLAAMVYTHNWALFLCVGLAVATAAVVRERLGLFALVAAAVALLYLPWLTSLLFQVRHTGAPWASVPGWRDLIVSPQAVLSGDGPFVALVLAAGVGLGGLVRGRESPERTIVTALVWVGGATIVTAWLASQFSPSWTTRYFAVVVGPSARTRRPQHRARRAFRRRCARDRRLLLGRLTVKDDKENAREIAAGIGALHPGELVDLHPSRAGAGASLLPRPQPAVRDHARSDGRPAAFDWVDVVDRLRGTKPQARRSTA